MAVRIFKFGCWVGGRHKSTLEYDEKWKLWYCPHCGWLPDD